MADEFDREELEAWLKTQPREVSIAIAARAALRVLPALVLDFDSALHLDRGETVRRVVLLVFRAIAVALAAARYPDRLNELLPSVEIVARVASESHYIAPITARRALTTIRSSTVANTVSYLVENMLGSSPSKFVRNFSDSVSIACQVDRSFVDHDRNGDKLLLQPLWLSNDPTVLLRYWSDLQHRLQRQRNDWDVWIRWYDAVLEGKPTPGGEELDIYRVTLDSEEDWAKGPAHVNVLIKAKEEEIAGRAQVVETSSSASKTSPEELAALASPQPRLSADGKLDVSPNAEFDVPVTDTDLTTLPIRQQRIIDVILSDLPVQSPRHLRPTLQHYGDELKSRSTQPILGILKDMAEIVLVACVANEDEWLAAGLRKSFDLFAQNHGLLMKHFPLDERREERYAETEVHEDAVSGKAFVEPFREAVDLIKSSDVATPSAILVMERMVEIAEITAYAPSRTDIGSIVPDSDHRWAQVSTKKRFVLQARGFWFAALPILTRIKNAIEWADKLRKLWELWDKFFPN